MSTTDKFQHWHEWIALRSDFLSAQTVIQETLGSAASLLRDNKPLPDLWRLAFADVLQRISEGESADRALGLVGPKGPKKKESRAAIAWMVTAARKHLGRLRGSKHDPGAIDFVAAAAGLSENTVESMYKDYKKAITRLEAEATELQSPLVDKLAELAHEMALMAIYEASARNAGEN